MDGLRHGDGGAGGEDCSGQAGTKGGNSSQGEERRIIDLVLSFSKRNTGTTLGLGRGQI